MLRYVVVAVVVTVVSCASLLWELHYCKQCEYKHTSKLLRCRALCMAYHVFHTIVACWFITMSAMHYECNALLINVNAFKRSLYSAHLLSADYSGYWQQCRKNARRCDCHKHKQRVLTQVSWYGRHIVWLYVDHAWTLQCYLIAILFIDSFYVCSCTLTLGLLSLLCARLCYFYCLLYTTHHITTATAAHYKYEVIAMLSKNRVTCYSTLIACFCLYSYSLYSYMSSLSLLLSSQSASLMLRLSTASRSAVSPDRSSKNDGLLHACVYTQTV